MTEPRHPTVHIETHGCKLNQADSQELARRFTEDGYRIVAEGQGADVYVVNTCTVTHVADRKARHALRNARRRNHAAVVVATGCYAQRASQALTSIAGIDLVTGNTGKEGLVDRVTGLLALPEVACSTGDAACLEPTTPLAMLKSSAPVQGRAPYPTSPTLTPSLPPSLAKGEGGKKSSLGTPQTPAGNLGSLHPPVESTEPRPLRMRAMVKIQEGCDQVCAYCIVPRVRGRERSIPPDALVAQVQRLVEQGHQEVVLTGTQLGSYGFDIPGADLVRLVDRLLNQTYVPRLRVSSLQPQEMTRELLELWDNPRLCPHFHLPMQSGSEAILRRMRRRYTPLQYANAVEAIRARIPDAAITADVIVGFPGETDALFQESYRLCQSIGFAGIHVFPYSPRPGTSAAHFTDAVEQRVKRKRTKRILALAKEQARLYRQGLLGTTRPVLWETSARVGRSTVWSGLADNYVRVAARSDEPLANRVTDATLERLVGDVVWGSAATQRTCATPTVQPASVPA